MLHRARRRFMQDRQQIGNRQPRADDGQQKPAERRLRDPVGLPRPAFDFFLRRVTRRGKERADRVQSDSEQGIGRDDIHQWIMVARILV